MIAIPDEWIFDIALPFFDLFPLDLPVG